MNLSITIKYAGDGSTSQINDVPSSCTISKLKKIVSQINKMESTAPIRLVQRGIILQDSQKIGDLFLNKENSLTIYATGIPGKIHKTSSSNVFVRSPAHLNTPVANDANGLQNHKTSILDKIKEFAQQNKRGIIMCVSLILLTVALAYTGIERDSNRMPKPKTYFSNSIQGLMKGQINKENALLILGIILILVWIAYIIKRIGLGSFISCTVLFFKTMLPTFDVEAYRNEHNLH